MKKSQPTRTLREHANLDQLKRQAKELLEAYKTGEAEAAAEVNAHYHGAESATFALHDAQLVLARSYGFDSWPKLKAYVDGVTVRRLADAVRGGDIETVKAMLKARPELVNVDMAENDEHRALHYAVLERAPEMVCALMEYGADARKGIYPHRGATGALTMAKERGYDEIVAIIEEEEGRRRVAAGGANTTDPALEGVLEAMRDGEDARAIAMLEKDSGLIRASNRSGWTPLHMAAALRNPRMAGWLLGHGAEADLRGPRNRTPLDIGARARWWKAGRPEGYAELAGMLRQRGAQMTATAAVALGDAAWLSARRADGTLSNATHADIFDSPPGLLTIAVEHDRPEILKLLLDSGFDPDERMRLDGLDEPVYSWGIPLWHCARSGKHQMAKMLLDRGADPNGQVYASGSVMYSAHVVHDKEMIGLLEDHGGMVDAATAGHLRLTERARQMLADEDAGRLREGSFTNESLVWELLWGGLRGGDPEIVRMTLNRVDWPRDDARWHGMLWSPLPRHETRSEEDRLLYLECFRLVLARCGPNARHPRVGRTILHDVAALDEQVPPDEALAFATMLLDAGAKMDERDDLLKGTPLGWACRWGRVELVKLMLERGADPLEADAEPWATPQAWATKMGHGDVLAVLREWGQERI